MAEICVFGAGSIGCYVGGRLAAAGNNVTFVGRQRLADETAHGLHLTDYNGADLRAAPQSYAFALNPDVAKSADLVLVCVKSAATKEAGAVLSAVLKSSAVVVSFQNGLDNAQDLAAELPGHQVLTGMVQFNVINRGNGAFHQGSEGSLETEQHPAIEPWLEAFAAAGLPLEQHADMRSVQWAKLLLNLNNAINALSGLPLKEELSQRDYRRCLALAQSEGLALLIKHGVTPAKLTPLPAKWIPKLLDVPDWLFRLLANRMLAIDPLARSSMWEDLQAGRRTEIDWLNGEIVNLAKALNAAAPVNQQLIELIRDAERGANTEWSGTDLLAQLQLAIARSRGL